MHRRIPINSYYANKLPWTPTFPSDKSRAFQNPKSHDRLHLASFQLLPQDVEVKLFLPPAQLFICWVFLGLLTNTRGLLYFFFFFKEFLTLYLLLLFCNCCLYKGNICISTSQLPLFSNKPCKWTLPSHQCASSLLSNGGERRVFFQEPHLAQAPVGHPPPAPRSRVRSGI